METYRVLLADDSGPARKAVRIILDSHPQFTVVAEAVNGAEAIQKSDELKPDLVLMDINMPLVKGFEATRVIKQQNPGTTVVILSVSDDSADLFEAIRNGAQGYLVKRLAPTDWTDYLLNIVNGDTPVPRNIADKILSEFKVSQRNEPLRPIKRILTDREQSILKLVATGATNREVAERLFISENTVKNHLKKIMKKLGIRNRVQLAKYAQDLSAH